MYSKININSKDGKIIAGNLYEAKNPLGWVLFLHSMQATKASYDVLAQRLQYLGYECLAIDFRGHGNSEGGPEEYLNYNERQHQDKIFDVIVAVDYLKNKFTENISGAIVGASIGSNLALQYIAENDNVNRAVLLSPGLNYRGVTTKNFVTKLVPSKRVLFVGSEDDNYTVEGINELVGLIPEGVNKEKIILKDAGHGATMFERHPELMENIINFIKS
jgi:alpha-beta hydrolase superfamily lysophospholipase